jgi:DNA polymerase-3 subunit alpha
MTSTKALEESPDLRKAYDNDKQIRELIDTAKKLEGLVRGKAYTRRRGHCAPRTHRTGAPRQDQERRNRDRLRHEGRRKNGPAQDGLPGPHHAHRHRRLPQAHRAARGEKLDIDTIPLDDEETFKKVFHSALTSGVFQFESSGMRDVLRRYKPDRWRTYRP